MRILKPHSDAETLEAFQNLTADEIFQNIRHFELDEKWFQVAVDKGLLKNMNSVQILLTSAEGGSLKYIEKAHVRVIIEHNEHIIDILNEALIIATHFGHLRVIEYLVNFGGDINLVLINSNDYPHIQSYALINGAKIHSKIIDKTTGESHTILWHLLQNVSASIADYVERQNQ